MSVSCHYCNDTCVVGGTMPWRNGTSHAAPCPYCLEGASPLIKFKPCVSPFTGSIMPVPEFSKNTEGMAAWLEPDLQGDRVIIVVDKSFRMWCWSETGRYTMDVEMTDEMTTLATSIAMDGYPEYSECGMAFEGIVSGDELWLYVVLPLTALLDGEDTYRLGGRRFDLKQAVERVGPALSYRMMPSKQLKVGKTINQAELDAACDEFGTNGVMVKQVYGTWGKTPCWTRYTREEDF